MVMTLDHSTKLKQVFLFALSKMTILETFKKPRFLEAIAKIIQMNDLHGLERMAQNVHDKYCLKQSDTPKKAPEAPPELQTVSDTPKKASEAPPEPQPVSQKPS